MNDPQSRANRFHDRKSSNLSCDTSDVSQEHDNNRSDLAVAAKWLRHCLPGVPAALVNPMTRMCLCFTGRRSLISLRSVCFHGGLLVPRTCLSSSTGSQTTYVLPIKRMVMQ